jgi:hypothetical protein
VVSWKELERHEDWALALDEDLDWAKVKDADSGSAKDGGLEPGMDEPKGSDLDEEPALALDVVLPGSESSRPVELVV